MKKDSLKTFVSLRQSLTAERERLTTRLNDISAALKPDSASGKGKSPKRTMSATARKKIAAAQRARWAKLKAASKGK